jgi:tetratricopeptide (TPR) repeat protein
LSWVGLIKILFVFIIFVLGVGIGRWSTSFTHDGVQKSQNTDVFQESSILNNDQSKSQLTVIPTHASGPPVLSEQSEVRPLFKREEIDKINKEMNQFFSYFMDAYGRNDIDEQNKQLTQMQLLDPKHEKMYHAKVISLQEDEKWELAHETLKECVDNIPDSAYCLRRLANIRTSSVDEKLEYGTRCLEVKKEDPLCLGDVAIALHLKGDYAKAKIYFEKALSVSLGRDGYNRNYLLYEYGLTLENLRMYQKAIEAFTEACRLQMKAACEKAL